MDPADDLPLVTVVIPAWNRLPLLRMAVDSVRAQTYPAWELMVADDGSTDGTAEWLAGLGDPRIRLVAGEHTGHLGRVRNRGAAAGKGSLVAFLDSDDAWLPARLETQVAAMRDAGCAWSYTGYELVDDAGRTIPFRAGGSHVRGGWIAREVLATEVGVILDTLLVDRTLFDRLGGFSEDARLHKRGDLDLAIRLAMAAPACAVDQTLVRVREHPGRITHTLDDAHERTAAVYELFLECDPPAELAPIARRIHARHLTTAARQRLARGESIAGLRLATRAFHAHPSIIPIARALVGGLRDRIRMKRDRPDSHPK